MRKIGKIENYAKKIENRGKSKVTENRKLRKNENYGKSKITEKKLQKIKIPKMRLFLDFSTLKSIRRFSYTVAKTCNICERSEHPPEAPPKAPSYRVRVIKPK